MNNEQYDPHKAAAIFDAGMDFLGRLPLANPMLAEQQLSQFLERLLADPPPTETLFRLLEQVRVPLCFVTEESSRIYYGKPVPLNKVEERSFQQVVDVWKKTAEAYALCASREEATASSPRYRTLVATLLHRCIYYTGSIIVEHFRARRELPEGIWRTLHEHYARAEEWGLTIEPVEDSLDPGSQTTHCAAAYVTLLLTECASPYSNSMRNLNLIRRWAGNWAPLVSVVPPPESASGTCFVVNLNEDRALHPQKAEENKDLLRTLDTSRLALKMNHALEQLRHRVSPSQLGLGEETYGHATTLIESLMKPWSMAEATRRFRRFAAVGSAEVVANLEDMYFSVNGRKFEQPATGTAFSRANYDKLFTFRHQVDGSKPLNITNTPTFTPENWAVLNHSANGFRLARSEAGDRLLHGQLICVKPHDGEHYLLAQITWLTQDASSNGVEAGVRTLPGVPAGVAVRIKVQGAPSSESFAPAFVLPGLPAIKEVESLVLPTGIYQASRVLEVAAPDGGLWQARMLHILERGTDFDRVSYQAV